MVSILRKGDTIKLKDGRHGVVFYFNRRIKHYQVICRDDYHELVRFEEVKVGGPSHDIRNWVHKP
jgi:hypothetical protein